MNNLSTVLLAIDGSYDDRSLLTEVESIAGNDRFRITILSVMESWGGGPEMDEAMSKLHTWESNLRSVQLEKLSAGLSARGFQVTVRHAIGKPYLEIIRHTLKGDYDLVIKPAIREGALTRLLLGGTDIQLLSHCPIPVWIFQPTISNTLKNIAVAVDFQPDDPERDALAGNVLNWGKFVAEKVGAKLHVIHAWGLYRGSSLRGRSTMSDIVDGLLDSKERWHRKRLHDALQLSGLDTDYVQLHLVKGEARELIPITVNETDIDLLIMGTVGRTGIPGFFIGNTADTVLRKVTCSVLAVKPDGFATQVEPTSQE